MSQPPPYNYAEQSEQKAPLNEKSETYPQQPQQYPAQQSQYPGQQYPGQQYPGQQYPGQQYPGQQYPQSQQYPGQPGAMYAPQGQVIVAAPSPVRKSYTMEIVMSCITAWCCCCIFGIIAFVYALKANESSKLGKNEEATSKGRISLRLSIAGIVIGIVLYVTLVLLQVLGGILIQTSAPVY